MKLAWLTDPHLDYAEPREWEVLKAELERRRPDVLLVGGDVGEGEALLPALEWLGEAAGCPMYFVLGNHDFYEGAIREVREAVQGFASTRRELTYLTGAGPVALAPEVGLVGHDGWGDGQVGDALGTPVELRDFEEIRDLQGLERPRLVERLGELGQEAADALEAPLREALGRFPLVVVLTHVPPFPEAAWHEGLPSNDEWSPFFVCGAMGTMLRRVAGEFPERQVRVLCGHTHGAGQVWIGPNLLVQTGGAVYGRPALQAPIFFKGALRGL